MNFLLRWTTCHKTPVNDYKTQYPVTPKTATITKMDKTNFRFKVFKIKTFSFFLVPHSHQIFISFIFIYNKLLYTFVLLRQTLSHVFVQINHTVRIWIAWGGLFSEWPSAAFSGTNTRSFRFHCVIMQLDFLSTPSVPWLSINYVSLGLDVRMTGTMHAGQDRTNGRESLKCTKMPSSLLQGLVVWLWRYGWRQGVG